MKYRFLSAAVIALAVATIVACGKSSPATPSNDRAGTTTVNNPGTPGSGTGRLSVSLKDSPFSEAKAVLVTFSEVSVHASGGAWQPLTFVTGSSRTCDLKQLEKVTDLLGVGTLTAGHYTQIRLTVTAATLYFDNAFTGAPCVETFTAPVGANASVTIPSGELKLNREFDLAADAVVNMLLDFDGDKSIHMAGNGKYQMSPVISIVSVQ